MKDAVSETNKRWVAPEEWGCLPKQISALHNIHIHTQKSKNECAPWFPLQSPSPKVETDSLLRLRSTKTGLEFVSLETRPSEAQGLQPL